MADEYEKKIQELNESKTDFFRGTKMFFLPIAREKMFAEYNGIPVMKSIFVVTLFFYYCHTHKEYTIFLYANDVTSKICFR